jgi:GalNAc-alpha-(1->4)-GalNAc-alpha-(1->3)-diNAcBac-PP-undecaprenol alpha-1,4-N-acetyl-D-galactosaminyltransferase
MNRNLIFFLPTFKVGGAGNSIFRLCKKLDLRQNNLFIISIGKNEYKKKFLQHSNKINIIEVERRSTIGSFFFLKKKILDIIKNKKKTIFISNQHYANVVSLLALRKIKDLKIIVVDRIDISELRKFYNISNYIKNIIVLLLVKFLYRFADAIISNSKSAKVDIEKITKSKVINISPPSILKLNKNKFKPKLKKQIQILTVGSLVKGKGVDTMIKSLSFLKSKNFIFKVAGDGEEKKSLQKLIKKLRLTDKVKLLGWRNKVEELYINSDLFIHASHQEGFPNSIVEAINFNLPVIASNCKGGTREILTNGKGGDLFPVNNHKILAYKINNFMKNQDNLNKKLKFARKHISKYTVENNYKKFIKIFNIV